MPRYTPLKKQVLADGVFEQLQQHIVGGTMSPGEPLPAERVLAEKLGVNRGAVREGLKRLAQAGLVDIRQGELTRVVDFRRRAGLELLAALIVTPEGINTRVARSVLELRAALAPDIARSCALRGAPAVAEGLDARVAAMRAPGIDLAQLQELALLFWGDLVRGSDNVAYELAFHAVDRTYRLIMAQLTRLLEAELRAVDDYAALAAAVGRKDGEGAAAAARTLVAHGARAIENVLTALDEVRP